MSRLKKKKFDENVMLERAVNSQLAKNQWAVINQNKL